MDGGTSSPPGAGGKYWEWSGKVQERGRRSALLSFGPTIVGNARRCPPAAMRDGRCSGGPPSPRAKPGDPYTSRLRDSRVAAPQAADHQSITVPASQRARGRARPGGGAVPPGDVLGRQRHGAGFRDAGPAEVGGRRCSARAVRAGDARGVAQPPLDRAGLELRRENPRRLLLAERARLANRDRRFGSVRGGERRPGAAPNPVLVASRPSRGEPARQVPAALPPAVARGVERRGERPVGALDALFRLPGRKIEGFQLEDARAAAARARLVPLVPAMRT